MNASTTHDTILETRLTMREVIADRARLKASKARLNALTDALRADDYIEALDRKAEKDDQELALRFACRSLYKEAREAGRHDLCWRLLNLFAETGIVPDAARFICDANGVPL